MACQKTVVLSDRGLRFLPPRGRRVVASGGGSGGRIAEGRIVIAADISALGLFDQQQRSSWIAHVSGFVSLGVPVGQGPATAPRIVISSHASRRGCSKGLGQRRRGAAPRNQWSEALAKPRRFS